MSYKDYSKDAVKAIIQKNRDSQNNQQTVRLTNSSALSFEELIEVGSEIGLDPEEVKKAARRYGHPEIPPENRMGKNHLHIERIFNSPLSEDEIWDKIQTELKPNDSDEEPEKIENPDRQEKWYHSIYPDYEPILSLFKNADKVKLQLNQQLGLWSPEVEGMVHSSYLSLILSGLLFALFGLELSHVIAATAILWPLNALFIYSLSIQKRKKKMSAMEKFANHMIKRITSDK